MENRIRIVLALFVPYAFFCAGLYQLMFWSTFNIDAFSFLDFGDIIKSFVYPFFYSASIALLISLIQYDTSYSIFPYGGGSKEPWSLRKRIAWTIIKLLYLSLLSYFILIDTSKTKGVFLPYLFLPGLHYVLSEFLLEKNLMPHEKYRFFLVYLFLMLPILSASTGKRNALKIFDNREYSYSPTLSKEAPIKFLGKASDHYVFTTLDNKDKFLIDISELKSLHLRDTICQPR